MDKERLARAIVDLYELMARLRGPGGCPWDAEQTDDSIKMYLLEEAHEVMEAIEGQSAGDVLGELGDLLFQIVFLARLAEERREFNLADVMEKIKEKMINRHPHVFGRIKVSGPREVAENWDRIKKQERGEEKDDLSGLAGIPGHLPSLLRSHRLSERAAKAGLGFENTKEVWDDLEKETAGLKEALNDGGPEAVSEKIGNLLFDLVNLARLNGLNAENLLRERNLIFLEQCKQDKRNKR